MSPRCRGSRGFHTEWPGGPGRGFIKFSSGRKGGKGGTTDFLSGQSRDPRMVRGGGYPAGRIVGCATKWLGRKVLENGSETILQGTR